MKKNRKASLILIAIIALLSSLLFGCSTDEEATSVPSKAKPVKVINVKEEVMPITLEYIGTIDTAELKKYSFKMPGKLDKVFVTKGQSVKKGDKLVQLAKDDLNYQLSAAQEQVNQAQAQYDKAIKGASAEDIRKAELNVKKAQDAYDYAKEYVEKLEKLYENESITKQDLDKAKLDLDMRESDLNIAKEMEQQAKKGLDNETKRTAAAQLEQSKINMEQKSSMLNDATLTAEMDGQVVDLLYKSGEIVNAGYPVVLIKSDRMIANVGVTQEDIEKIKENQKVLVSVNEDKVEGKVAYINPLPDKQTRTYNVEVELTNPIFKIGMITSASFVIGEDKGIWIPISSIMANGTDYVFIVDKNQVIKKNITLGETKGTQVLVNGLTPGDKVVVEGMKELTVGEKVKTEIVK